MESNSSSNQFTVSVKGLETFATPKDWSIGGEGSINSCSSLTLKLENAIHPKHFPLLLHKTQFCIR